MLSRLGMSAKPAKRHTEATSTATLGLVALLSISVVAINQVGASAALTSKMSSSIDTGRLAAPSNAGLFSSVFGPKVKASSPSSSSSSSSSFPSSSSSSSSSQASAATAMATAPPVTATATASTATTSAAGLMPIKSAAPQRMLSQSAESMGLLGQQVQRPFGANLRNLLGVAASASSQAAAGSLVDLASISAKSADRLSSSAGGSMANFDPLDSFDAKNPFSDESLWQIPSHLSEANEPHERAAGSARVPAPTGAHSAPARLDANRDDDDNDNDESGAEPRDSVGDSVGKLAQPSAAGPSIVSASTDLKTAAGYHYPSSSHHGYDSAAYDSKPYAGHADHHYGGYYQYASVPYPYAWDFGYRRGNPYHTIERHEHGKGPHFQTKVKWSDKYGGYGVHVWDYNHDDHHSHHYAGQHDSGYSHPPAQYGYHAG